MNIVVLGAAGGIGRHVVLQALEVGHHVTAFVRDPAKLQLRHERLSVVRGDVFDRDAVKSTISHHDAVVCTVGTRSRGPTTVYSEAARNAIAAMTAEGIRRYIGISASGFHRDANDPVLMRYIAKPLTMMAFKQSYKDLARMEGVVAASDLNATIVVPPRLTNGPKTGLYRVALNGNVRYGLSISRADVAHNIVEHLAQTPTSPSLVFLAY